MLNTGDRAPGWSTETQATRKGHSSCAMPCVDLPISPAPSQWPIVRRFMAVPRRHRAERNDGAGQTTAQNHVLQDKP